MLQGQFLQTAPRLLTQAGRVGTKKMTEPGRASIRQTCELSTVVGVSFPTQSSLIEPGLGGIMVV